MRNPPTPVDGGRSAPAAVVVECLVPRHKPRFQEVRSMLETLGYGAPDYVAQRRDDYDPAFCIGKGKVEEIGRLVRERGVSLVAFANRLSGGQVYRLQREFGDGVRVLDRNLVILEVFEKRAMTTEARLQIELARLRYTISWGREVVRDKDISGVQVGWSGPGGYPFWAYERETRKRISRIVRMLRALRLKKEMMRERRRVMGLPVVALAGYTQSGKTTFFNRVVSELKETGLGPFTTLSPCVRRVSHAPGEDFVLVDSIGFIEDMHPLILEAFNTTLSEIAKADLILLFIDASEELKSVVVKASASAKALSSISPQAPVLLCLNKVDLLDGDRLDEAGRLVKGIFPGCEAFRISSTRGDNVEGLIERIQTAVSRPGVKGFVHHPPAF